MLSVWRFLFLTWESSFHHLHDKLMVFIGSLSIRKVGQYYEVSYARGVGKVKGELSQEEGAKLQNKKVNKI